MGKSRRSAARRVIPGRAKGMAFCGDLSRRWRRHRPHSPDRPRCQQDGRTAEDRRLSSLAAVRQRGFLLPAAAILVHVSGTILFKWHHSEWREGRLHRRHGIAAADVRVRRSSRECPGSVRMVVMGVSAHQARAVRHQRRMGGLQHRRTEYADHGAVPEDPHAHAHRHRAHWPRGRLHGQRRTL